jgi:hypothetical protein
LHRVSTYWRLALLVAVVIGGGIGLMTAAGPLDPTACHVPDSTALYLDCVAPHPFDPALGVVPGLSFTIVVLAIALVIWVAPQAWNRR